MEVNFGGSSSSSSSTSGGGGGLFHGESVSGQLLNMEIPVTGTGCAVSPLRSIIRHD